MAFSHRLSLPFTEHPAQTGFEDPAVENAAGRIRHINPWEDYQ